MSNDRIGDDRLPNYTKEQWNAKKEVLMEKCYDRFGEYGLHGAGIRALAKHCGCTSNMLYTYFENLDDLIIQSAEYCMSKVEDEFMAKTPQMQRTCGGLWARYRTGRQKSTAGNTA